MLKSTMSNFPQLTFAEFAAWLQATHKLGANSYGGASIVKHWISKLFIGAIASSEKQFSVPVYKFLKDYEFDNRFIISLMRYFGYVCIDAGATSALVSALYSVRLRKTGVMHSKLNFIYPILVTLLGTLLKIILAAAAMLYLSAMPIVALFFVVISNILYFYDDTYYSGKTSLKLFETFKAAFGVILSLLMSNINPVFLFKTIFVDSYILVNIIDKINLDVKVKEMAKNLDESQHASSPVAKISFAYSLTNNYQKEIAQEVVVFFDVLDGVKLPLLKHVINEFGGGYIVNRPSFLIDKCMYSDKNNIFNICSQNSKNIIARIKNGLNGDNCLKLVFTNAADDHDQVSIAVVFTRVIKKIASDINNCIPRVDISNCRVITSEIITANIPGLNNSETQDIVFIDRKDTISSSPDTLRSKRESNRDLLIV